MYQTFQSITEESMAGISLQSSSNIMSISSKGSRFGNFITASSTVPIILDASYPFKHTSFPSADFHHPFCMPWFND